MDKIKALLFTLLIAVIALGLMLLPRLLGEANAIYLLAVMFMVVVVSIITEE